MRIHIHHAAFPYLVGGCSPGDMQYSMAYRVGITQICIAQRRTLPEHCTHICGSEFFVAIDEPDFEILFRSEAVSYKRVNAATCVPGVRGELTCKGYA